MYLCTMIVVTERPEDVRERESGESPELFLQL